MTHRLHRFAESGNAYEAAPMLALCEADWEPVRVAYFDGGARTPEFLALNPLGEVPVLETDDGLTLSQSGVILDHLAETLGRFGARDAAERREILRWLLFDNHKLTSYVATLRFLRTFTDRGEDEVTAFLDARARGALATLDRHLDGRDFALGERPTIADVSMCGYLYRPAEIGNETPRSLLQALAPNHGGGTTRPVQAVPSGFGPHAVGFGDYLRDFDLGTGNAPLDVER